MEIQIRKSHHGPKKQKSPKMILYLCLPNDFSAFFQNPLRAKTRNGEKGQNRIYFKFYSYENTENSKFLFNCGECNKKNKRVSKQIITPETNVNDETFQSKFPEFGLSNPAAILGIGLKWVGGLRLKRKVMFDKVCFFMTLIIKFSHLHVYIIFSKIIL